MKKYKIGSDKTFETYLCEADSIEGAIDFVAEQIKAEVMSVRIQHDGYATADLWLDGSTYFIMVTLAAGE